MPTAYQCWVCSCCTYIHNPPDKIKFLVCAICSTPKDGENNNQQIGNKRDDEDNNVIVVDNNRDEDDDDDSIIVVNDDDEDHDNIIVVDDDDEDDNNIIIIDGDDDDVVAVVDSETAKNNIKRNSNSGSGLNISVSDGNDDNCISRRIGPIAQTPNAASSLDSSLPLPLSPRKYINGFFGSKKPSPITVVPMLERLEVNRSTSITSTATIAMAEKNKKNAPSSFFSPNKKIMSSHNIMERNNIVTRCNEILFQENDKEINANAATAAADIKENQTVNNFINSSSSSPPSPFSLPIPSFSYNNNKFLTSDSSIGAYFGKNLYTCSNHTSTSTNTSMKNVTTEEAKDESLLILFQPTEKKQKTTATATSSTIPTATAKETQATKVVRREIHEETKTKEIQLHEKKKRKENQHSLYCSYNHNKDNDNDQKRNTTNYNSSTKRRRSLLDVLKPRPSSSFLPYLARIRNYSSPSSTSASNYHDIQNIEELSNYCPMTVIHNILPKQTAKRLLEQLESTSSTWNRGNWIVHGKEHAIPRTTATFHIDGNGMGSNGDDGDDESRHGCSNSRSRTSIMNKNRSDNNASYGNGDEHGDDGEYYDHCNYNNQTVTEEQQQQDRAKGTAVPTEIYEAAKHITDAVHQLRPWLKHTENEWVPNFILANRYENGNEYVGWHSDHLTVLGPRPIIVGLSLGACRRFELRQKIQDDDCHTYINNNGAAQQKQQKQQQIASTSSGWKITTEKNGIAKTTTTKMKATTTTSIDSNRIKASKKNNTATMGKHVSVYLPHNSAVIMWNDAQESWQHSIPKCGSKKYESSSILEHPQVGCKRISLTLRMRKKLPSHILQKKCYCGKSVGLKCNKNGKYYLFCEPYGKHKHETCNFWKPCTWADQEAAKLLQQETYYRNQYSKPPTQQKEKQAENK